MKRVQHGLWWGWVAVLVVGLTAGAWGQQRSRGSIYGNQELMQQELSQIRDAIKLPPEEKQRIHEMKREIETLFGLANVDYQRTQFLEGYGLGELIRAYTFAFRGIRCDGPTLVHLLTVLEESPKLLGVQWLRAEWAQPETSEPADVELDVVLFHVNSDEVDHVTPEVAQAALQFIERYNHPSRVVFPPVSECLDQLPEGIWLETLEYVKHTWVELQGSAPTARELVVFMDRLREHPEIFQSVALTHPPEVVDYDAERQAQARAAAAVAGTAPDEANEQDADELEEEEAVSTPIPPRVRFRGLHCVLAQPHAATDEVVADSPVEMEGR